jgi:rhodanese-related sulfurtransferase
VAGHAIDLGGYRIGMVNEITLESVNRLWKSGEAQLVEVLPAEEFAWAHLPGARNLPLKDLTADAAERLDRSRPVVAYCNDFL